MTSRTYLLGLASLLMVILLASPSKSEAALIQIPLSAFSGSANVADFAVAATQGLPYSEDGATFASFSGLQASVLSVNNFLFMAGTGVLTVTFGSPVTRTGFQVSPSFFPLQISIAAFADLQGTQSVGQLALGSFAANQAAFAGVEATAPFSRVSIGFTTQTTTASYFIDDFRFERGPGSVPEPATLATMLLGAGWLAGRRRRKV